MLSKDGKNYVASNYTDPNTYIEYPNSVDTDMYMFHRNLMWQGGRQGIQDHTVMQAAAVVFAIESGEVPCSADQETVENHLAATTLDIRSILTFMNLYPEFIAPATAYAIAQHPYVFYILTDEWSAQHPFAQDLGLGDPFEPSLDDENYKSIILQYGGTPELVHQYEIYLHAAQSITVPDYPQEKMDRIEAVFKDAANNATIVAGLKNILLS